MGTGDFTQGEDRDVSESIYSSGICEEHSDKMQRFECLELVAYHLLCGDWFDSGSPQSKLVSLFLLPKERGEYTGILPRHSGAEQFTTNLPREMSLRDTAME